MAIGRDFPQSNTKYTAPGCYDLPAMVTIRNEGTPKEQKEVLTRWSLSREDIDYIIKNAAIWMVTIGGVFPVSLYAEPMFTIEPGSGEVPLEDKPYSHTAYYYIGVHMVSLWGKECVEKDDGHNFMISLNGSVVALEENGDHLVLTILNQNKTSTVSFGYYGRIETLADFMRIFELSKPL